MKRKGIDLMKMSKLFGKHFSGHKWSIAVFDLEKRKFFEFVQKMRKKNYYKPILMQNTLFS